LGFAFAGAAAQVAMRGARVVAAFQQPIRQPVGQHHAAMPSAGAANGNREVGFAFFFKLRQAKTHKAVKVLEILLGQRSRIT
jgi:hypothetical protein